jgi:tripartite-type tricarboxylate transporter receptor subunit TctC
MFAPARMPDVLVAALSAEIQRIAASDAFRSRLEPLGVIAVAGLAGAAFLEFQRGEISKWGRAVHDAGVRMD